MTKLADAIARLERSSRTFVAAFEGVSAREWRCRPTGEEWSLADTVEHVVLTNRAVYEAFRRLLTAPLPAGAHRLDDAAISAAMFENAPPAPPGLADPTGRFATSGEGVAALTGSCEALVTLAREAPVDLRAHGLPHPVFGTFDGVQWLLFAAAHTDNHLPQLQALRASGVSG